MKKAYVFPGQGAQFVGMGKDLYDQYPQAKAMFEEANEILGFRITDVMFGGTDEDLRQTRVTQVAVFLHSVVAAMVVDKDGMDGNGGTDCKSAPAVTTNGGDNVPVGADLRVRPSTTDATNASEGEHVGSPLQDDKKTIPDMVAGHSLGEFSALVVAGALSFGDGLRLVYARALAMQRACELRAGTMAAILGLEDDVVEGICADVTRHCEGGTTEAIQIASPAARNDDYIVVPANYNSPGQLVISGTIEGVELACEKLKEAGAKRALPLKVGGAFHSPLMQPASDELQKAIEQTTFKTPICPIYQNVDAKPHTDPEIIKRNLILQLTAPVRWRGIVENMLADGGTDCKSAPAIASTGSATDAIEFTEFGPGNVLMGLIGKIRG